jgi:2'-hydroxyisoflavone reductase
MNITRRDALIGLAVGMGFAVAPAKLFAGATSRSLRILVLGGTGFIGPHVVQHALDRGHDVTLFNRGRTNTDMFPGVKKLVGDRDNGLAALEKGEWDVVLDNSGYVPRHVKDSAALLKDRVGRYLFTSSVSAYDFSKPELPLTPARNAKPGSPLAVLPEPGSEDVGKYYGALKVVAEKYVEEIYRERATIVRPTYVAGPGDRTQRFTWWVERINRGGDIIVPGNADGSFAIIDVRDLAEFYVTLLEADQSGIFNASGPAGVMTYAGMLDGIRATTNSSVSFHRIDEFFLQEQGVTGRELPMWNAGERGKTIPFENQSSIDVGLRFRTLAKTARDTHAWYQTLSSEQQKFSRAGLALDKEAKVLAAWRALES